MSAERGQNGTPWKEASAIASTQRGLVTRDQLRALDLSDTTISRWVHAERLHPQHLGVYLLGHDVAPAGAPYLAAVMACGDDAALSHRSATEHLGVLPVVARRRIDVTSTRKRGERDPRILLHRVRSLDPRDVTEVGGIRVTTVARTLVDLAGSATRSVLLQAIAGAEGKGIYEEEAVQAVLARSNGRRGAAALRAVLSEPVPFTRSELERRFLPLCRRHEIPRPLVNHPVLDHTVDFVWLEAKVIVEVDSRAWHRDPRAFEADRRRDVELHLAGWLVLRFTWRRVVADPAGVATDVRRALALRDVPISAR